MARRNTKVVTVPTTAPTTPILAANAGRIGYVIQNIGTYDVAIAEVSTVTCDTASTAGHLVKGGQVPPDYAADGVDTGNVYTRSSGGSATLVVIEYLPN